MKKTIFNCLSVLIALWIVFSISVYADENSTSKSQLTVPWEEFKKILRIDENEIVLPIETFNKLVAQTGTKVPPSHVMRKGLVVMTREEFKLFVDKMIEPPDSAAIPPFDFLITKAIYSGKMGKTSTTFTVRFHIHVLKKNTYIKIPLLYQSLALEDIKVDNKPALVISENGYYQTVIDRPGEHFAEAVFSVKSNLDQGPYRLDLSILKTLLEQQGIKTLSDALKFKGFSEQMIGSLGDLIDTGLILNFKTCNSRSF